MLKLVKYEYRRNIAGIAIMLIGIVGLQGYFLGATAFARQDHVIAAASLLAMTSMVAIVGVLLYSIGLYSRELNAKTSYLTFMTPHSSAKILGAKLLATLFLGAVVACLLYLFAAWDITLLTRTFPELNLVQFITERALQEMGTNLSTVLLVAGSIVLEFLISFFSTVVVAYLAITLSATVFQNKKFKGIVSFALFVAIFFGVNWLCSLLPIADEMQSVQQLILNMVPLMLVHLALIVGSFLLSAWLLENKVSL